MSQWDVDYFKKRANGPTCLVTPSGSPSLTKDVSLTKGTEPTHTETNT